MQITEIHTAGFESYIYIAFVVVGWIVSMIRKMNKKNPQKPSNPYQSTAQPSSQPAFPDEFKDVFEDLFQDREKEVVVQPVVVEQEKTLREQRLEREQQAKEQEQELVANQQFAKYSGEVDTMEMHGGTPDSQKRFGNYKITKTNKASKYRKLINNKTDIRRAIIGAEILNRKY